MSRMQVEVVVVVVVVAPVVVVPVAVVVAAAAVVEVAKEAKGGETLADSDEGTTGTTDRRSAALFT
jgi:hypothetical protein